MRSAPGCIYIVFHSFLKETTNAWPQWPRADTFTVRVIDPLRAK